MNQVFCSQHCLKVKINLLDDGRMKGKIRKLAKCLVSEKNLKTLKSSLFVHLGGTTEGSTWCLPFKKGFRYNHFWRRISNKPFK